MIGPIHADFNAFLAENGEAPYPLGQFFEASPYMNLLLYPEAVKFKRRHAAGPDAVPVPRGLRPHREALHGADLREEQRRAR